jgi:integrase
MRVPATETVTVKPELIRLVRRADSKGWQVHYKLDGVKNCFRRSTDTSDVKEAARIIERMCMKATFDHEEGRPVISKKFKPVAETVLRKLDEEIKAGTAKASARDYVSAIKL